MTDTSKSGRQVQARVRRSIDRRLAAKPARSGATKTALRESLQDNYPPPLISHALELKGVTFRSATADDLFDVLYGITWAASNGKSLSEYFSTSWATEMQSVPLLAA